jgi:PIN domain nuclease of toxin-antitoxin system
MSGPLILDTHVWFWFAQTDLKLDRSSALAVIRSALEKNRLAVSVISVWELAMLESKGRLALRPNGQQWIDEALSLPGLELLPLTPRIAVESTRLPGDLHGDPADRMIVASARVLAGTVVTADAKIIAYGQAGMASVLEV